MRSNSQKHQPPRPRSLVDDADVAFLIDALRAHSNPSSDGSFVSVPQSWARLHSLATRHLISPIVFSVLRQSGRVNELPPTACQLFLADYHGTALRNEFILERLGRILNALSRSGIEVIVLKGLALCHEVYRPGQRALGDVDLLVREGDFSVLRRVLEEIGYRTNLPDLDDTDLALFAHTIGQIRFQASTPPILELHFRLLNTGIPTAEEPSWRDARVIEYVGPGARALSTERMLLHLCLHAQQHGFAALRLFGDIALWLRTMVIDQAKFERCAREHRHPTAAYYGLTYTGALFDYWPCESARAALQPSVLRQAVLGFISNDRLVRAVKRSPLPQEAELPLLYLLGAEPFAKKLAFLGRVLVPRATWCKAVYGGRMGHLRRLLHPHQTRRCN